MGQQEWTGPTTGLGVVKAMAFALGGASPEGVEVVFCVGWTEKLLGQGGPSSPCEWGSGWPLGLLSGEPQALTGLFLHRKARALIPALPLAFPQPQPHSSPLVSSFEGVVTQLKSAGSQILSWGPSGGHCPLWGLSLVSVCRWDSSGGRTAPKPRGGCWAGKEG